MYYIEQLKKKLEEVAKDLRDGLAHIKTPEFKAQFPGSSWYPGALGAVEWRLDSAARDIEHMGFWYLEQIRPEVAYMERLAAVCEGLGIDEDNLPMLELLVKEGGYAGRYKHEASELAEKIRQTANEVYDDQRDREHDNAIEALEAAGFKENTDDGDLYERGNQTAIIQWKGGEYQWRLEVDGVETLTGCSGEFSKLLEAVKQEVAL
jgi:hypothetical protein